MKSLQQSVQETVAASLIYHMQMTWVLPDEMSRQDKNSDLGGAAWFRSHMPQRA